MVPTVRFTMTKYNDNWDFVKQLFLEKSDTLDYNKYITDLFPNLKNIDDTLSEEEKLKLLKFEFDREWKESENLFLDSIDKYGNVWNKYNDVYLEKISEYLNIKWPEEFPFISGEIGLYPVFPRYLEEFKFCIYPGLSDERIINVSAHEILHFLWFYKWKELFPEFIISDSNPQDNIWKYSEIVVDPILNSKEIKSILNIEMDMKTYDIFYEMKYNNESVVEHLRNIFNEDVSIEKKILKGFEYFNKVLESEKELVNS